MAPTLTTTRIQLKRDTAANWTSNNPILAQGEPGLETDTGYMKIGDGTTTWNALAYLPQGLAPTAVKTSGYTAKAGDYVACNVTSAGFTVTLPTAPADKTRVGVKIVANASTPNTLTIARGGTDVFNVAAGSTTLALTAKFMGVMLQYQASTGIWYVQSLDSATGNPGGAASLGTDGKHKSTEIPTSVVNGISQARKLNATSPHIRAMADNSLASQITPTFTTEAASSLTLPQSIPSVSGGVVNANVPWIYLGADVAVVAGTYVCPLAPTNNGVRAANTSFPYQVAFDFDGQAFDIDVDRAGGGGPFRVWANEQASAYQTIAGTGGDTFIKVDFGSRAQRRIVLEGDYGFIFGGITYAKTDSIKPPSQVAGGKLAIVGDSYAIGQGVQTVNVSAQSYAFVLAKLLGFADFRMYGQSGTGLLATNGTVGKYRTRINDVLGYQPDLVLIQGSINDAASGGAGTLGPEIASYVASLQAGLPAATQLAACSPIGASGNQSTANVANGADLKAAFATAGVPYVDALAETWFTGTGKVGTTTGDGNADFYQSSFSANHPSLGGHDYIARRLARSISVLLGLGL